MTSWHLILFSPGGGGLFSGRGGNVIGSFCGENDPGGWGVENPGYSLRVQGKNMNCSAAAFVVFLFLLGNFTCAHLYVCTTSTSLVKCLVYFSKVQVPCRFSGSPLPSNIGIKESLAVLFCQASGSRTYHDSYLHH